MEGEDEAFIKWQNCEIYTFIPIGSEMEEEFIKSSRNECMKYFDLKCKKSYSNWALKIILAFVYRFGPLVPHYLYFET